MDNALLLGLGVVVVLGAGVLGGLLIGKPRQRRLQRELEQVQSALQQSHTEMQQREEALQQSRNEVQQREEALQQSQQEVQRSREELCQQQEELQRSQQEVRRSQEEAWQYRTQVMQHFTQTAELLQTLTLNYRVVYEHLAAGAAALCEGQVTTLTPETLRERLLAPPPPQGTVSAEVVAAQSLVSSPDAEQSSSLSSKDSQHTEHEG